MATIEENLKLWEKDYKWPDGGDEWSSGWGNPETQWYATILPRIHGFIPARSILEIAPGFGRWTQRLKGNCEKLIVVDLSLRCIEACRKRFQSDTHITYHVNDGKSLKTVEDNSIDFVFSFDSLVHADADVIEAYLSQLVNNLSPKGIGFIHHSNLGMYVDKSTGKIPDNVKNTGWRSENMSASLFLEFCESAGLECIHQETVSWGPTLFLNDCFSVFRRKGSKESRLPNVLNNKKFMLEAENSSSIFQSYSKMLSYIRDTKEA